MAARRGKRKYTSREVAEMIANDSDSEGLNAEYDSDMLIEDSDSDSSQQTANILPETPGNSSVNSQSDTDDPFQRSGTFRQRGRQPVRSRRARGRGRWCHSIRRGRGNIRQHRQNERVPVVRNQQNENDGGQQQQNEPVPVRRQNDHNDADFNWEDYDWADPFVPNWLPQFNAPRGVLVDTSNYSPVDYFSLFFPDEAFELICAETNRYALQFFDNPVELSEHSRFKEWGDTSVSELKAYIALQIAMGLCQKNELEDYWGTFWLTRLPFTEIMPRNRYELLTSFLHFANNEEERHARGDPGYDHLWKVRPLLNICEPRYLDTYGPRCDLSIDESIIRFKGRVSFRQYLPAKPYKWGIKQFALCESKTGYVLKFITYCGKGTVEMRDGFSITESLCLDLMSGFTNKGHKVFTDNYYTSPNLYREFERNLTGACGTVKAGRKHMPADIHPQRLHLRKGDEPRFMRSGNMVACAWHDTKRVHFLSTTDSNNTIDKRVRQRGAEGGHRTVEKPVIAEVYNQSMGGVDLLDQKLGTFAYPHKSSKWYNVVFHRVREVALVNGYIMYCEDPRNEEIPPRVFREKVISGLLEDYNNPATKRGRPSKADQPDRLTERHFIAQVENKNFRPECAVCSDRYKAGWKRKQTCFKCKQCDIPMCPAPCHEIYHTYKNFRQEAGRRVHHL